MGNLTIMGNDEFVNKFAVIGDPIEYSISPFLHNEVFKQLGLNANYQKIFVENRNLKRFITQNDIKRLNGFNVTIPHKTEIINYLDVVNPRAIEIGAVNCVLNKNNQLWGFNTDWYGFSMALKQNKIDLFNKSILILGAGGVTYSVLYSLIRGNVNQVFIKNRTKKNTDTLINNFKSMSNEINIVDYNNVNPKNSDYDILINCTSLGMNPFQKSSPLNEELILPKHTVIDTIYTPFKTTLLLSAENRGAKILNGLDMFIFQALASLDIWFGKSIAEKIDTQLIKEKLIKHLC